MKHIEFGGGLGDVITVMYTSNRYASLETLTPEEEVLIVLTSHNPCVGEFFRWHPKRGQFKIRDVGFWWPNEDVEKRKLHNLPQAPPYIFERQSILRFYPAPDEAEGLNLLSSLGRYVVVSACAGGIDRNIPRHVVEEAIRLAVDRGFKVVVIGRKYNIGRLGNREEYEFPETPNVLNLVDRLSIPATAEAIKYAAGILCCHSGMCLLSWYLHKPVFLLYPKAVRDTHFHSTHQYTFGKDFPTTMHMQFSEYKRELFEGFLSSL